MIAKGTAPTRSTASKKGCGSTPSRDAIAATSARRRGEQLEDVYFAEHRLQPSLETGRPIRCPAGNDDMQTVRGECLDLIAEDERQLLDQEVALVEAVEQEM